MVLLVGDPDSLLIGRMLITCTDEGSLSLWPDGQEKVHLSRERGKGGRIVMEAYKLRGRDREDRRNNTLTMC